MGALRAQGNRLDGRRSPRDAVPPLPLSVGVALPAHLLSDQQRPNTPAIPGKEEHVDAWDDAFGASPGPRPGLRAGRAGPGSCPLTIEERAGVLDDLAELEVFRTLLEPTGVKGIVVDCPDCDEEHHVDWALMQANLRQLLDEGQTWAARAAVRPRPRRLRQLGLRQWLRRRGGRTGRARGADRTARHGRSARPRRLTLLGRQYTPRTTPRRPARRKGVTVPFR